MPLSYSSEGGACCPACVSEDSRFVQDWPLRWGRYELYQYTACRLRYAWPMRPGSAEFYASCPTSVSREGHRLPGLEKILQRDWRIREFRRGDR